MGLEEILKQVEETGKEKAAEIRKATVEEVEAKMEEASKESNELVSQIKSETSRRIEQLKQQEIPAAELESGVLVLFLSCSAGFRDLELCS